MSFVLIESNRDSYISKRMEDLEDVSIKTSGIVDFATNSWSTHLTSGIQISPNDVIEVQNVMLNTQGDGNTSLELLGENSGKKWKDNETNIKFAYYITNQHQFNCNLPLSASFIKKTGERLSDYGMPDNSIWAGFIRNYPFGGIRGFKDNGTAISYGTFSNGALYKTDETRFFLGPEVFNGYGSMTVTPWTKQTNTVNIKLDKGFNTPSRIGEQITTQLHTQDGNFVNASGLKYFEISNGALESHPQPDLSSKLYKAIETSCGALLYGRLSGRWNAAFEGETSLTEGDNYVESEGNYMMHSRLLVGNPEQYEALGYWLKTRENFCNVDNIVGPGNSGFENQGLYTGVSASAGVGTFGLNPVFTDYLLDRGVYTYYYPTSKTTNALSSTLNMINTPQYTLITTNLPYNSRMMGLIASHNRLIENPSNSETILTETPLNWEMKLPFGRADDMQCLPANGTKIYLRAPYHIINGYPGQSDSYRQLSDTTFTLAGYLSQGGDIDVNSYSYDSGSSAWFFTKYSPTFETQAFHLSSQSHFQETNYLTGKKYSKSLAEQYNVACVPVYYKQANLPNAALAGIPFIAFIMSRGRSPSEQCAVPCKGEFFGLSPSQSDNLLAKVVSTQKVVTPYSDTFDNTQDYMPHCYIGASESIVQFDDVNSKFTISYLHTPHSGSSNTYQYPLTTISNQADQESGVVYNNVAMISGVDYAGNFVFPVDVKQKGDSIISARGGVTIESIINSDGSVLDPYKPFKFVDTIWDKMGFDIQQLIPYYGGRQVRFNRFNFNSGFYINDISVQKTLLTKPVTTNAFFSSAEQMSFATNTENQDMSNFGAIQPNNSVLISVNSDVIIARYLPRKMAYSHLLIYSDIVRDNVYFNNGGKIPCICVVNRNFTTGDYFFDSGKSSFVAQSSYILSDLSIKVMLPNGLPVELGENSTIIFKIIKNENVASVK